MDLSKIVEDFGKQCERLLRGIDLDRPLTEEELVFVRYYCNQLSEKTAQGSMDPTKGCKPCHMGRTLQRQNWRR